MLFILINYKMLYEFVFRDLLVFKQMSNILFVLA